jgi:hypothetical protein
MGAHLFATGLSDRHPSVLCYSPKYDLGIAAYQNSFDVNSVAVYKKISSGPLSLKYGLTTGYRSTLFYKGRYYHTGGLFLSDTVMLMLVPEVTIYRDRWQYSINLVGDSINLGIGINL